MEKEKQQKREIEEERIINYFKGKDIVKADELLIDTAKNNFEAGFQKAKEQYNELRIDRDKWMIKFAKQKEQYALALKKVKEEIYGEIGLLWDLRHYNIAKRILDKHFGVLDNQSQEDLKNQIPGRGGALDTRKGCGKYYTRGAYTFTCGESSLKGKVQLCPECSKKEFSKLEDDEGKGK